MKYPVVSLGLSYWLWQVKILSPPMNSSTSSHLIPYSHGFCAAVLNASAPYPTTRHAYLPTFTKLGQHNPTLRVPADMSLSLPIEIWSHITSFLNLEDAWRLKLLDKTFLSSALKLRYGTLHLTVQDQPPLGKWEELMKSLEKKIESYRIPHHAKLCKQLVLTPHLEYQLPLLPNIATPTLPSNLYHFGNFIHAMKTTTLFRGGNVADAISTHLESAPFGNVDSLEITIPKDNEAFIFPIVQDELQYGTAWRRCKYIETAWNRFVRENLTELTLRFGAGQSELICPTPTTEYASSLPNLRKLRIQVRSRRLPLAERKDSHDSVGNLQRLVSISPNLESLHLSTDDSDDPWAHIRGPLSLPSLLPADQSTHGQLKNLLLVFSSWDTDSPEATTLKHFFRDYGSQLQSLVFCGRPNILAQDCIPLCSSLTSLRCILTPELAANISRISRSLVILKVEIPTMESYTTMLETLVFGLKSATQLRSLAVNMPQLPTSKFFSDLAENVPRLHSLEVYTSQQSESELDMDMICDIEIQSKAYADLNSLDPSFQFWSLHALTIHHGNGFLLPLYGAMSKIAEVVPSVQSFAHQGHMRMPRREEYKAVQMERIENRERRSRDINDAELGMPFWVESWDEEFF
ncbi:hypothetical protein DL96DRAFT_1630882 [Flagelloscypha sp. PMI_526]|nr:hypothetical protein DL96DRAFT_1630882 [Flagelloscypha sp. PMI_526]